MKGFHSQLKASGSTIALMATALFAFSAHAQNAPAGGSQDTSAGSSGMETVVVTGTSIRGIAPVGSNLLTMDQQDIADIAPMTISEALADLPALTGMDNTGRGSNGNGGPGASVYIHQIGASAQNSTLVLMDGHRLPVAGTSNTVTDPNVIPENMLERVEVLADGASSVYGSDAVSGVVNFITRTQFDGLELHYQGQSELGATGQFGSVLAGQNWDKGGLIAAYTYSFEPAVKDTTLPRTNPLLQSPYAQAAGDTGTTGSTTNFGNFLCNPATVQPNGSGNYYLNAQGTANVSSAAANATCSQWQYEDYLPQETRQNAMMKLKQNLSETVTLTADAIWESRVAVAATSRGTLQATAFGSGAQANPFYIDPPGVTATKQTILYDFDQLLGPGATTSQGDLELVGDAGLDWNINNNWVADLTMSTGRSDSYTGETHGVVNAGLATLDLNGTNQSSGTIPTGTSTSTAVVGTNTVVTQLPLTTANALDVWDPVATNKTSAATLAALIAPQANNNLSHGVNSYEQYRLSTNGTLFTTAAGPVKLAAGVEEFDSQLYEYTVAPENAGPSSVSSTFQTFNFGRQVTSEYVEADIPVVGPNMNVPFTQKIDLDVSARHDGYSDVGPTTNPKVSFDWFTVDGLKFRGSWSTSFVAPSLIHDVSNGISGLSNISESVPGVLPVALFPAVTQLGIAGCTASSVTCNTSSLQGLASSNNTQNLKPERGHGWTLGFDYTPTTFLSGFTSSVTWWHVSYFGGATNPTAQIDAYNPLLNYRITLLPPSVTGNGTPCATQAQIAAFIGNTPVNTVIPACVSVFSLSNTANLINFWASGIDATLGYHFDTDFGSFLVTDSLSQGLTFLQGFGPNPPPPAYRYDVENTVGLNTTFPNVGMQMRAHLGWALDPFVADIYANYVGSYTNVGSTATNAVGTNASLIYNGTGGDKVGANLTFDLHIGYDFSTEYSGTDNLSLTVKNIFNTYPPYFNGSAGNGLDGFDNYVSNPLGRVIEVGLDAKL